MTVLNLIAGWLWTAIKIYLYFFAVTLLICLGALLYMATRPGKQLD